MTFHTPTIVAIHGSASSSKQWATLRAASEPEYKLTAPTTPEADAETRLDAILAPIVEAHTPVHLVAHSFGSCIAMKAANILPFGIASITLFDPVVPVLEFGKTTVPTDLNALATAMAHATPEAGMALFIDFWSGNGTWAILSGRRRASLTSRYSSVVRDFEQVFSGDWTPARQRYKGPLTVLHGDRSPSIIEETARYLAKAYPQAWRIPIPHLDHMAPLTNAHVTDQLFLDSIECNRFPNTFDNVA